MDSSLQADYPLMDMVDAALPAEFLTALSGLPGEIAIPASVVSGIQLGMLVGTRHPSEALRLLDSCPEETQRAARESLTGFMKAYGQFVR